jgi:rhodanese-related sulfurtransferase
MIAQLTELRVMEFINHHAWLVSAFIVLLLFFLGLEFRARKMRARQVSPQGAVQLINHSDAAVIDIRASAVFEQGHILNAVNIEGPTLDIDAVRLQKYRDQALIIVCQTGHTALVQATRLREKGWEQVYALQGGMTAWVDASLPLQKRK